MKQTSKKRSVILDDFPNAELRRERMLAYLDASKDDFRCRLEKAAQLSIKVSGVLAGPTVKSGK